MRTFLLKIVFIFQHPAIASNKTLESTYPALDVGVNRDIFIKVNSTYIEGQVNKFIFNILRKDLKLNLSI